MEGLSVGDKHVLLQVIYGALAKSEYPLSTKDIEEHFNMAVRLVSGEADAKNAERSTRICKALEELFAEYEQIKKAE